MSHAAPPVPLPPDELRFRIVGMDCPSCAAKVDSAVCLVEGVDDTTTSTTTMMLRVTTAPGAAPAVAEVGCGRRLRALPDKVIGLRHGGRLARLVGPDGQARRDLG